MPTIPPAVSSVKVRVSGVVTITSTVSAVATSTAYIRIRRGADAWNTNYHIGTGGGITRSLVIPDTVFSVVTGDAIYIQLSVDNGGLNTAVYASANKETRLVIGIE